MKQLYFVLLTFLTCTLALQAQQINFNQPPNSSFLAEYGISPKIFNMLVSPMYQEDAQFSAKSTYSETIGSNTESSTTEIIYDPFYEYGLTFKLVVHDPSTYEHSSKSQLKKMVGKTNEKYKRIRDRDVIDEQDVGILEDNASNTILGFQLEKNRLPNHLKYLSKFTGTVHIIDGKLDRIELNLASPQKIGKVRATSGRYLVTFKKMENGGYLLDTYLEEIEGTKNEANYHRIDKIEVLEYTDRYGNIMNEYSTKTAYERTNPSLDTLKVKLERSLPLLGNAARRAGYELPLPYGVDIFTHFQREDLGLESIVLNGEDLTQDVLAKTGSSARAITNLVAARGDVWILPFFNVTLMTGYIYGTTEVNLALSDEMKETLDLIGIQAENITVTTDITGPMAGAGMTLAGGYKNFFATVNAMYINQFVNEANTEVDAYAITPLVGVRFPKVLNVVVGGQYQLYNSNVSGSINVEGENLNYSVELKANRWNWLVGLQRDFSNRWNGTIMMGGEPRPQTTIVLGYRF